MSVPKSVEAQPHYLYPGGGEVWDARVILPNLSIPAPTKEFKFGSDPLQLFETDWLAKPHRGEGFVNGLTQVGHAGRDGETHSGFIELVDVVTPQYDRSAIIRSYQFDHETGIPTDSWMLEFDDVDIAKSFWNSTQHYFHRDQVAEVLKEFIYDNQDAEDKIRGFTELGLLTPWYLQQANTPSFRLGSFAINRGDLTQDDTELDPGRVYRIAINPWFTTQVSKYLAKTCLGSKIVKESKSGLSWGVEPVTYIQWDDGSMTRYTEKDSLPEPLKTSGIKKPSKSVRPATIIGE